MFVGRPMRLRQNPLSTNVEHVAPAGSLRIVAHLQERPERLADSAAGGADRDDPRAGRWVEELRGSLDRFDALVQDRDFLLGDSFGVADLAVFPFLKYGVVLNDEDDEVFHRILVEHLRPAARHPRLRAWIDRVEELPRAGRRQ